MESEALNPTAPRIHRPGRLSSIERCVEGTFSDKTKAVRTMAAIALACGGVLCGCSTERGRAAELGAGPGFPHSESFYPLEAQRAGQEGTARVHVCVDVQGRLSDSPVIAASTGNLILDAAALKLAQAGTGYRPPLRNGVRVPGCDRDASATLLRAATVVTDGPLLSFPEPKKRGRAHGCFSDTRAYDRYVKAYRDVVTSDVHAHRPPSELAKPRGRARRRWERYGAGAQLSERAQAAGVNDVIRKLLVRRDIAEPLARALHKSAG
jgi:TonB family protein